MLGTAFNRLASELQERRATEQREEAALYRFIQDVQPLLLEINLKGVSLGMEVRSVARALTLATLFQLRSDGTAAKRTLVISVLYAAGMNNKPGFMIGLEEGTNLDGIELRYAQLWQANLRRASPPRGESVLCRSGGRQPQPGRSFKCSSTSRASGE